MQIQSSNAELFLCPQARRLSGEEPWQKHFRLQKRKDHFLWTIESTGIATEASTVPCVRHLELCMSSGMCDFAGFRLTEGALFAGQRPEELFLTAIDILEAKCDKLLESL